MVAGQAISARRLASRGLSMRFRPPEQPPPKIQTPGSYIPGNMFEISCVAALGRWFQRKRRRRGPGVLSSIIRAVRWCVGLPQCKVKHPKEAPPPEGGPR